jgi:hypothetical protein
MGKKLSNHANIKKIVCIYLILVCEINVQVNYQLMGFLDAFLRYFLSFPWLVSNIYDMAMEKTSQLLQYEMLVK